MSQPPLIRRPLRYSFYNATLGLIIANIAVFFVQLVSRGSGVTSSFGMIPQAVLGDGEVWRLLTYLFLHGSPMHILFNMLALFFFGGSVERAIGSSEFLLFYFLSGILAGLATAAFSYSAGGIEAIRPVIGASGAVFAIMLAFATINPDAVVYVWFVPVRAPFLVLIYAGLTIFNQLTGRLNGVSHVAHLGGLLVGYLYLRLRLGRDPVDMFRR